MKQFYLMMQTVENSAGFSASPPHLTLSLYARVLTQARATLVVSVSVHFSGAAMAKRLILLEEICVCKQNPLHCVMKKSRLYHSLAMMFFTRACGYTSMHARTVLLTHAQAETHTHKPK